MAATFDYTSLLPGNLESTLQTLAKVYQTNSDKLSNAYLYTVLPGVNTSARMSHYLILSTLSINPPFFKKIS